MSSNPVQFFLFLQFHVEDSPDRLLENVQVSEEISRYENQNQTDDAGDGVTDAGSENIGQDEPDAENDRRDQDGDGGVDEDPDTDDEHQQDQKNDMPDVADDQFHAFADCFENTLFADDNGRFSEVGKELQNA